MEYGMLINYGLCTGCDTCEVNDQGYASEVAAKKMDSLKGDLEKLGGAWEWDYVPVPSRLCDLCAERRAQGKVAPCEMHCLAKVIEILPVDKIAERMVELGGKKVTCFMP